MYAYVHTYINVYTFINVSMYIYIHTGAKWVCLMRYLVVSKSHMMHYLFVQVCMHMCIHIQFSYESIHIHILLHVYVRTYKPERGVPHAISSRIEIARDGSFICILCMHMCIHV